MSRIFIWRRIPLRMQGLLFNSLPLIAVLLTATFSFFSNQQREHMEMSVNRHFEMVENLVDIQTYLLNAEAGLRGYLLTFSSPLLRPYDEARAMIPKKLDRVAALIDTIPKPARRVEKLARFAAVRGQVEAELETLAAMVPTGEDIGAAPALNSESDFGSEILRDQPMLKSTDAQLSRLHADEERLLGKRLDDIRSIRKRDFLLIFLSIVGGLASRAIALYFFHRRVIRRVRQLTENARSLRDGSTLVHEPSDHGDDIGELERELARIGDYLAERRLNT